MIRTYQSSRIGQLNTPTFHTDDWYDFNNEGAIRVFNAAQQDCGPNVRGK